MESPGSDIDEPIHLEPHSAAWASWFAADAKELKAGLGPHLQALEHFGSTAVPGMTAKPIIDILVAPTTWPPSVAFLTSAKLLGYEHLGEAGVPGRAYLRRRADHHTNLAVVAWQGPLWRNNVSIRDFLRANPEAAARYVIAKCRAWESATTLLAYSSAKASFMTELLNEALKAREGP
jgi:GrpB-like predicted nucleotidyltransferase (UPF0157 family)